MPTNTQEQPVAYTDRRSRRTRAALRDALAAEIKATGDLSQVTVTAVTDRADVTRRTFYSHYRDIPTLVRCIEDETIEELRPYVTRIAQTTLDELEEAIEAFNTCPGSIELLEYFKENGTYLSALLGDGGDPAFSKRLSDMVREQVYGRVVEGLAVPQADTIVEYYLTFAISAGVGVLVRWLTTGMQEPVGIMARMMTALMFVRPGDLYGRPIGFDIPSLARTAAVRRKEFSYGSDN
ncbi:MAG: TetR family transcriptional regulator C-terminal domain-containing protein [Atopobiaceae bacterium]|nr:TetR family transcriptional regulator C-terminal domain-containing protein [Atopobiaceae bacterium]